MTISDEELYRLADKAAPRPSMKTDLSVVNCDEYRELKALRNAVLQRFKPREPRVVEQIGYMNQIGRFVQVPSGESARQHAAIQNGYPAKAVITEVMEGE